MDTLPSKEFPSELKPTEEVPPIFSLFTRDDEVEPPEAQLYDLKNELDLPLPFESEDSNCACN